MDLKHVEAELQVVFPNDYCALAVPSEGGCVQALDDVWHVPGAAELLYYVREGLESDGFPGDGIVIAYNGCGDYLFLRRSARLGEVDSRVFHFDHETEDMVAVDTPLATLFRNLRPKEELVRLLSDV